MSYNLDIYDFTELPTGALEEHIQFLSKIIDPLEDENFFGQVALGAETAAVAMLEAQEQVVGGGLCYEIANDSRFVLDAIAVSSEHRGRGGGARIVTELARFAINHGASQLELRPTEAATSLYARLGFRPSITDRSILVVGVDDVLDVIG